MDDTNGAIKIFGKNLLLLPHGNFAIELERVEQCFEIHGEIVSFDCIKNATDVAYTYLDQQYLFIFTSIHVKAYNIHF